MAIIRDMSRAQMAFQVEGGELDLFQVSRYRGTEGLSQLYRFEIELIAFDEIDFAQMVGKSAVLSVSTILGSKWFHGMVGRFEYTGQGHEQNYYRAELVPKVWMLTHRYNSRIFQNKSVKDIVTDVLTKGGIPSDRFRFELKGSCEPREYCVQYRETDYNFICRLLETEGIWWYFEQSKDAHILVMADDASAYKPVDGDEKLPYVQVSGLNNDEEHVFRLRLGQSVRPGAVALNDFNFENPKLKLESKSDAGRDSGFEFSDYPGQYATQARGSNLARTRMEEFEAGRTIAIGQSNSQRLLPARTFTLDEHPIDSLNRSYVVTSVTHQGKQAVLRSSTGSNGRAGLLDTSVQQSLIAARQSNDTTTRELANALLQLVSRFQTADPTASRALSQWVYHAGQVSSDLANVAAALGANPLQILAVPNLVEDLARTSLIDLDSPIYECRFECIPSEVSFRPPRVTPWPDMRGAQTARIVGPKGEEIYTDKYGRVKVQFNWDREGKFDENSSCWIRVSQGMAAGQYGIMFLPRVGQEVVIDFLEGDPDKPLIVGRVFNADHMPPYALPDEKTKSVIKTNSTKGGGGTNEFRFEDSKGKEQILLYAEKDLHIRAKNARVETIGADRHLTVVGNKAELVKKAKHLEVKLDQNEKIGGKKSLKVAGDVAEEFGGNHSEKAGSIYLKGGSTIVIEAGTALTLKVGGNFVQIDASGVTILGTMVKINSGGSAGSGSLVALKAPDAPSEADKVQPGKDTTYSGGEELPTNEAPPEVEGHEFKQSWIEIELKDEEGNPVPGQVVKVVDPDGQLLAQTETGDDGIAHVLVDKQGDCQISFPKLDADAWRRG